MRLRRALKCAFAYDELWLSRGNPVDVEVQLPTNEPVVFLHVLQVAYGLRL